MARTGAVACAATTRRAAQITLYAPAQITRYARATADALVLPEVFLDFVPFDTA